MTLAPEEACLACLAVEDAYDVAGAATAPLEIPLDPRLEAIGYTVKGHFTAVDELAKIDSVRRWYGWVLEDKQGTAVAVIRGTDGWEEWIEDMEGDAIVVPGFPGHVEAGFMGIYHSLKLRLPGASADLPLVMGVHAVVGDAPLTVAGHSLGAALATYLAYELAAARPISARLFASPKPGNREFVALFGSRVPDHMMWRNVRDLVPDVPPGGDYCAVPNVTELVPGANGNVIKDTPFANHHALCYLTMLAPALAKASVLHPIDDPYEACITWGA